MATIGAAITVKVKARTIPKWNWSTSLISFMITWQEEKVKQPAITRAMPNTGRKKDAIRENIVGGFLKRTEK